MSDKCRLFLPTGHAGETPETAGLEPFLSVGTVRSSQRRRGSSATAPMMSPNTRPFLGLEEALGRGATAISIYLDSELLVRQIQGVYRVKNPSLKPLMANIQALLGR